MEPPQLPLLTGFGVIRRTRPSDIGRIVQMVECLAAHHGDRAELTSDQLARDLFGETPWIFALVAEAEGQLVGSAAMCGMIRLQLGMRGMDLHHLFTEAGLRGRGIGRCLIEACKIEAAAMSCRYMTVGTHPDNLKAQAFYTSLGIERRDAHPPRFVIQLG